MSCVHRRKLFMYLCHSFALNHCQFTVVCNTSASIHTHTHTKCPICHSTQTELLFQINTTLFMNPRLDVKCAVHMVDNTAIWTISVAPHLHFLLVVCCK